MESSNISRADDICILSAKAACVFNSFIEVSKVATGVIAFQFELLVDTVIVAMLATDCLFAISFCLSLFITLCLFNGCLPGNFLV